jgi:hypothetical protein
MPAATLQLLIFSSRSLIQRDLGKAIIETCFVLQFLLGEIPRVPLKLSFLFYPIRAFTLYGLILYMFVHICLQSHTFMHICTVKILYCCISYGATFDSVLY